MTTTAFDDQFTPETQTIASISTEFVNDQRGGLTENALVAKLQDPTAVYVAMLRGEIAKITWRQMVHLSGPVPNTADEALAEIVRLRAEVKQLNVIISRLARRVRTRWRCEMTTTACDDQFTVGTQTIERVRQPYDTASILRRNVADLELALRTQTELKEKAEAELAQARQQKPLIWGTSGELMDILKNPIYSSPAPVPAPAVPELDPMTRLIVSDPKQLKPKKQEPAVPSVVFMAHNKTSSILFAARKDADQYAASFGPAAGVSVTECAVIGSQSAPQAPAVPEEWRDVMQDAHDTFQRYADQHRAKDTRDSHEKANVNQKLANRLYALLQSAEVTK